MDSLYTMPMLLATLIMLEGSQGWIMDMDMLLDMELLVTEDMLAMDIMDMPAMATDTMGKERLTLTPSLMPTLLPRSTMDFPYTMPMPLATPIMLVRSPVLIMDMDVFQGMELLGTEDMPDMDTLAMLIMGTMDITASVKLTLTPSLMPTLLPRSTMDFLYTMPILLDILTMLEL